MKDEKPWYVTERAEALAVVFLTERPDIRITPAPRDQRLDFLVDQQRRGRAAGRPFGLVVCGTEETLTPKKAARLLQTTLRSRRAGAPTAFPVGVIVFSVVSNEGFFAWEAEPVLTLDGQPKLRRGGPIKVLPLTPAALDEIVGGVDRWYEALMAALAV